jgi:hypothetical protein
MFFVDRTKHGGMPPAFCLSYQGSCTLTIGETGFLNRPTLGDLLLESTLLFLRVLSEDSCAALSRNTLLYAIG